MAEELGRDLDRAEQGEEFPEVEGPGPAARAQEVAPLQAEACGIAAAVGRAGRAHPAARGLVRAAGPASEAVRDRALDLALLAVADLVPAAEVQAMEVALGPASAAAREVVMGQVESLEVARVGDPAVVPGLAVQAASRAVAVAQVAQAQAVAASDPAAVVPAIPPGLAV